MKKLIVAIGGASGSIYAKVLLDKLVTLEHEMAAVGVIMSENAKITWKIEMQNEDYLNFPFKIYEQNDFFAPFASGSAGYDAMIICPASMGIIGRIAGGISDNLTTRAADVMLKERKKLIIVPREMPYNLVHLEQMKTITLSGGIICPASPSFYSRPKDFEALAATVVDKALTLAGFEIDGYQWGQ